jgi:hypothetical protein
MSAGHARDFGRDLLRGRQAGLARPGALADPVPLGPVEGQFPAVRREEVLP